MILTKGALFLTINQDSINLCKHKNGNNCTDNSQVIKFYNLTFKKTFICMP
jgi:hypothetical protein